MESNEQSNDVFNDAPDLLVNGKYKQPQFTKMPLNNELSVLSLNVKLC